METNKEADFESGKLISGSIYRHGNLLIHVTFKIQ